MNTHADPVRRALLALPLAAAAPACQALELGWRGASTRGSGKLVEQTLELPPFDSVDVADAIAVQLEQVQGAAALHIEIDDNLLPLIDARVKDGRLLLRQKRPFNATKARLVLQVWKLQAISVSGSGAVASEGLVAKHLKISASGSGSLRLDPLTAETLELHLGGSSTVKLAGQANELSASIGGSGVLQATAMAVRRAAVAVGGSGVARLQVLDALSGSVGGSGLLGYRGDPALTVSRGGSGRLSRLTE